MRSGGRSGPEKPGGGAPPPPTRLRHPRSRPRRAPHHPSRAGARLRAMAQVLDRALCPVLVGRAVQLEALEDALLAANRAEGQVVVLAGEAGMGKTRLAEELQAVARRG